MIPKGPIKNSLNFKSDLWKPNIKLHLTLYNTKNYIKIQQTITFPNSTNNNKNKKSRIVGK